MQQELHLLQGCPKLLAWRLRLELPRRQQQDWRWLLELLRQRPLGLEKQTRCEQRQLHRR